MKAAFDLHFHSCLSPCGDGAMTPATIAGLCKLAGLDVAALTDHNTCGNCAAFCQACQAYGLLGLPGMELCTAEEVHVVCLLPDLAAADAFSRMVYDRLPPLENDRDIFGPQIYMDADDNVLGEERRMLAGASSIGVYEVRELAARFGGVAIRPTSTALRLLCFPTWAFGTPRWASHWPSCPVIARRILRRAGPIWPGCGPSPAPTPTTWIRLQMPANTCTCPNGLRGQSWIGCFMEVKNRT